MPILLHKISNYIALWEEQGMTHLHHSWGCHVPIVWHHSQSHWFSTKIIFILFLWSKIEFLQLVQLNFLLKIGLDIFIVLFRIFSKCWYGSFLQNKSYGMTLCNFHKLRNIGCCQKDSNLNYNAFVCRPYKIMALKVGNFSVFI